MLGSTMELSGQVGLVTGGARGIGAAVARALAEAGADVAVADVRDTQESAAAVRARGRRAYEIELDVTDRDAAARQVTDLAGRAGRVDVVVTCAGVLGGAADPAVPLDAVDEDEADFVLDVNLKGTLWTVQAAMPHLRRTRGRVVCVASLGARVGGIVSGPHYVAGKGGVISLVRWLARSGAPDGVRVNAVAPGFVRTEMSNGHPVPESYCVLGRLGEPDDIAYPILFLAAPASGYITGHCLDVNGGAYMG